MWQAYQYGHGKLKLVKDLKTGQAHLRVSLIDQEEIDNMGKIYQQRKIYYKVDEDSQYVPPPQEEAQLEEGTGHLSYKEKVDLYRKRLQSQKLQDKYNNLFKKTEKRRYQMRNPILYKLLQNFEETHKHEDHSRVVEDLKDSEKNLEMIKINTNRRAKFDQSFLEDMSIQRPRFISLQNSLPEKEKQTFPKWVDYAQGKYVKVDNSSSKFTMQSLQAKLQQFVPKHMMKSKKPSQMKDHQRQIHSPMKDKHSPTGRIPVLQHHQSSVNEEPPFDPLKKCDICMKKQPEQIVEEHVFRQRISKSKTAQGCRNSIKQNQTLFEQHKDRMFKSRTAQTATRGRHHSGQNITATANRTFTRSQNYSKDVIATMSGFYSSKASKQQEYKKMVLYLKNDRPLTSDIRRKSYKMIGQTQMQGVKQYRNNSQIQRIKLKNRNYQFYVGLLKAMQKHTVEELPLSGKIIESIRIVLQSNYSICPHSFQQISEPALYESKDPMSDYLLEQLQQLMHS